MMTNTSPDRAAADLPSSGGHIWTQRAGRTANELASGGGGSSSAFVSFSARSSCPSCLT